MPPQALLGQKHLKGRSWTLRRPPSFPARSRSSWTATAAGRPRAASRPRKATARARARSGAPSRRRSTSGIESLTVYAFSTENWSRPPAEVDELMEIFGETIERELPDLAEQGVRTRFIGRRDRAPDWICSRRWPGWRRRPPATTACSSGSPSTTAAARRSSRRSGGCSANGIDAREPRRGGVRASPVRAGPARPRPDHPHVGRAADLELPALAARLRGARLRGHALAGLRRGASSARRSRRTPAAGAGSAGAETCTR